MSISNLANNSVFKISCHHCKQICYDEKQLYYCSLQFSEGTFDSKRKRKKLQHCSKAYCQQCIVRNYPSFTTSSSTWCCPCCQESCLSKTCIQGNKQSKSCRVYVGQEITQKVTVDAILNPERIKCFTNHSSIDCSGAFDIIQSTLNLPLSTSSTTFDPINEEVQIFQFVLGSCEVSSMCVTSLYEIADQFLRWMLHTMSQEIEEEQRGKYIDMFAAFILPLLEKIVAIMYGDSVKQSSNGIFYGLNLTSYNSRTFVSHPLLEMMKTNKLEFLRRWKECNITKASVEWENQELWYRSWNKLLRLYSKGLSYLKYYQQVLHFLPNGNTWRPGTCTKDMFTGSTNSQWLMYRIFVEQYEYWPKPQTTNIQFTPPIYREEDSLKHIVLQCGYSTCVNPYCIVGIYNNEASQIVSNQSIERNARIFEDALKRYKFSTEKKHHSVPQRQWLKNLLGHVKSPQTMFRCTADNYIGPRLHSPCFVERDDETNSFRYFSVIWYLFGYKVPMPILHHSQWHLDRTCSYPQCISPQCYRTLGEMKNGIFYQPLYNHHLSSIQGFNRYPHQINYPGSFRFAGNISFHSYPTESQISLFEEQRNILIPFEYNEQTPTPAVTSAPYRVYSIEEQYYRERTIKVVCRRLIQKQVFDRIHKTSDLSKYQKDYRWMNAVTDISDDEHQHIISRLRRERTFVQNENSSSVLFQSVSSLSDFISPFIKTLSHKTAFNQIQITKTINGQQWPCWTCYDDKNKPVIINCEKFKIPIREFMCALTIKQWELTWNMFFQKCPCPNNTNMKKFKNCCFTKLKWSCNGENIGCMQPAHIIYTPVPQAMLDALKSVPPISKTIKTNLSFSKEKVDEEQHLLCQCLLYVTLPQYGLICPKTQRDFNIKERINLINSQWNSHQVNEFDQNWKSWLKPMLIRKHRRNQLIGFEQQLFHASRLSFYQIKNYLQKQFEHYYGQIDRAHVQPALWQSINLLNGIMFQKQNIYNLMHESKIYNSIEFLHMTTIYRYGRTVMPIQPSLSNTQLKRYQLLQLINLGTWKSTYDWFELIPIEKVQNDFQCFQDQKIDSIHQLLFHDIRKVDIDQNHAEFLKEWSRIANILSFDSISLQLYSPKKESSFGKVFYSSTEQHWIVSIFEHGSIVLAILYGTWIQTITNAQCIPNAFHHIISNFPVNLGFQFKSNMDDYPLTIRESPKIHDMSLHCPTLFGFRLCSPNTTVKLLQEEALKMIQPNSIFKNVIEKELNDTKQMATKYILIQFLSKFLIRKTIEFSLEKTFRKPLNWTIPNLFYGYFSGTSNKQTGSRFHFLLLPRVAFMEQLMLHHLTAQLHHYCFPLDPTVRLNTANIQNLPCTPYVIEAFFSKNPNLVYCSIKLMYAWLTWTFPDNYYDDKWEEKSLMTPNAYSFPNYYLLPKLLMKLFSKPSQLQQSYNDGFGNNNSLHRPELKFSKHKPPPIASPHPTRSYLVNILRIFLGCQQSFEMGQQDALYLIDELDKYFGDPTQEVNKLMKEKTMSNNKSEEEKEWLSRLYHLRISLKAQSKNDSGIFRNPYEDNYNPYFNSLERPMIFYSAIENLMWIAAHSKTPASLTSFIFASLRRKEGDDHRLKAKQYIPSKLKNKWINLSRSFNNPSLVSSIMIKKTTNSHQVQSIAIPLRTNKVNNEILYMTELITILEYGFDHLYSKNWQNDEEKSYSISVTTQQCWYPFQPMEYVYPSMILAENNQDGSNKFELLYWQHWFPMYDNLANLRLSSESMLDSKYNTMEQELELDQYDESIQ